MCASGGEICIHIDMEPFHYIIMDLRVQILETTDFIRSHQCLCKVKLVRLPVQSNVYEPKSKSVT